VTEPSSMRKRMQRKKNTIFGDLTLGFGHLQSSGLAGGFNCTGQNGCA
jgi:hypothetical protein